MAAARRNVNGAAQLYQLAYWPSSMAAMKISAMAQWRLSSSARNARQLSSYSARNIVGGGSINAAKCGGNPPHHQGETYIFGGWRIAGSVANNRGGGGINRYRIMAASGWRRG